MLKKAIVGDRSVAQRATEQMSLGKFSFFKKSNVYIELRFLPFFFFSNKELANKLTGPSITHSPALLV